MPHTSGQGHRVETVAMQAYSQRVGIVGRVVFYMSAVILLLKVSEACFHFCSDGYFKLAKQARYFSFRNVAEPGVDS